jgi:DNA-binding transcriptional ArsR family regulator
MEPGEPPSEPTQEEGRLAAVSEACDGEAGVQASETATRALADLLGVLSHPHRVQIVEELRREERDVNQLAEALGVSHARVSQHLSMLRAHHVVVDRRAGRHVHYRLAHQGMAAWLLSGLDWIAAEAGQAEGVLAAIEATRALWGG